MNIIPLIYSDEVKALCTVMYVPIMIFSLLVFPYAWSFSSSQCICFFIHIVNEKLEQNKTENKQTKNNKTNKLQNLVRHLGSLLGDSLFGIMSTILNNHVLSPILQTV